MLFDSVSECGLLRDDHRVNVCRNARKTRLCKAGASGKSAPMGWNTGLEHARRAWQHPRYSFLQIFDIYRSETYGY
jgi:hypothetical protein